MVSAKSFFFLLPVVCFAAVSIENISPSEIPPFYDGDIFVSFTSASESLSYPRALCRFVFLNGTAIETLVSQKGWQQTNVAKWLTCPVPTGFKDSNMTVFIDLNRNVPILSINSLPLNVTGLSSIVSELVDEPATPHDASFTLTGVNLQTDNTLTLMPACPLEGCPTGQSCVKDRCYLTEGLRVWIPGTDTPLDYSGNSNLAILNHFSNTPTPFQMEKVGSLKGIALPAQTALEISMTNSTFLSGCSPRTISMRVAGMKYSSFKTYLASFGELNSSPKEFQFFVSGAGQLGIGTDYTGTNDKIVVNSNVLQTSQWTHVAVALGDQGGCRTTLWIDGEVQFTSSLLASINMVNNLVRIGARTNSDPRNNLWVGDIRIYNRVLSNEQMKTVYSESMFEPTALFGGLDLTPTIVPTTSGRAVATDLTYQNRTYVVYMDGVRQAKALLRLPLSVYYISSFFASSGENVTVSLNGPVPVNGNLLCRFGAGFVYQALETDESNAVKCIVPLVSVDATSVVSLSVSVDGSTFSRGATFNVSNKVASVLQFANLHDFTSVMHKVMQDDTPIQGIVQVRNPKDLLLYVYTAAARSNQAFLRSWLSMNMSSDEDQDVNCIAYGTADRVNAVDMAFSSIGGYVLNTTGTHIGALAYYLGGGAATSGYDDMASSSVSWVVLQGAVFHASPIFTQSFSISLAMPGSWSDLTVGVQQIPLTHTITLLQPTVLLSFYKLTARTSIISRHLKCTQVIDSAASAMSGYMVDLAKPQDMACTGFTAGLYQAGTHHLEFKMSGDPQLDSTVDHTYAFNVVELPVEDGAAVYSQVASQAITIFSAAIGPWYSVPDLSVEFTLVRARSVLFYYNIVLNNPNHKNVHVRAKVNDNIAQEAQTTSSTAETCTTQATWIQRLPAGTYNLSVEYSLQDVDVFSFLAEPDAACSVLALVLPETAVTNVLPKVVHTGYVGAITVHLNSASRAELGKARCLFNNTYITTITSIDKVANTVTCNVPYLVAAGDLYVEVSLDGLSYSMDSNVTLSVLYPSVSITLSSLPNVTKYDPTVHTVNIQAQITWYPPTYKPSFSSTWQFAGDDSGFHYLTSKYNSTYLVIGPNSFQPGSVARFEFIYQDPRGLASTQIIYLNINSPPTSGTFACSPTTGIPFDTNFTLTMSSWTDSDTGGLKYAFAVLSADSTSEVLLAPASSLSSVSLPLPAGAAAKGYRVTLVGYVYDRYGMATRVTTNVTVNGTAVSESVIQGQLQTLQSRVSLMSTSNALQTLAVLGTTMFEVLTDRATAKSNFDTVFSVLSGVSSGLSSADSVQAIDTISRLTSQPSLLTNGSQITASSILNSSLAFAVSSPSAVNPSTVLNTVSNIASAVELSAAAESNSSTFTSYQSGVYSSLGGSVSTLVNIVGSTLVPYQTTTTTSPKVNLTVEYAPASEFASRNLTSSSSSSGTSFTAYIPQNVFTNQALASDDTPVFGVLLEFGFNPHSNSSGAANLTSATTELTFYSDLSTSTQAGLAIQGLSSPILLYIPLANNTNTSSVSCQFLNTSVNTWQTSGCSVHSVTNDTCVCACTHTTMFAVAGSVWSDSNIGVIDNFDKLGNILGAIGLYVFAAASALYIALVAWGKKKDRQEWEQLDLHDDDSDEEEEPSMFQMLREHLCAGKKHQSMYAAPLQTTVIKSAPTTTTHDLSGKQGSSTSQVVPRRGFKSASPANSPLNATKHAASSRKVTPFKSSDAEIEDDKAPFLPLKMERSALAAAKTSMAEPHLPNSVAEPLRLQAECSSPAASVRSIDLCVGNDSRRSLEESEHASLIKVPSSTADGEFVNPLKRKMTVKRIVAHIKEEHLLLSVMFFTKKRFSRAARVTLYFCIVLSHLVAAALFYNADDNACEGDPVCSEDVGFFDGITEFGWADFWVSVYSILITIPINLALMYLFKSKRIMPGSSAAKRARIVKSNLQRRRIAYTVSAMFASFCAFYLVMFTLSFNIRVSYRWITSWAVATVQDFAVWENAGILSRVMLIRYVLGPLFLYRMVELSYKRRQARRVVAAPHATSK